MATLSQILSYYWPNNSYILGDENNYDTLEWGAGNPDPKPTLLEIQSKDVQVVNGHLATLALNTKKTQRLLEANKDHFIIIIDTLIQAIKEINQSNPNILQQSTKDKLAQIDAKINEIKNLT